MIDKVIENLPYVVLDTNVLLLDAGNLLQPGKVVVISEVVIDEMDSKKSLIGSELGYQARQFSRLLSKAKLVNVQEKIIRKHSYLSTATEGTNTITETLLEIDGCYIIFTSFSSYIAQEGLSYSNDRKILECAKYYSWTKQAVFISNDNAARLRAVSLGIEAQEFAITEEVKINFTKELYVDAEVFTCINTLPLIEIDPEYTKGTFNYIIKCSETEQVKLCYVHNDKLVHIDAKMEKEIRKNADIAPMNAQQLFLARALQDTTTDIIIVEALAGSGKTLMAISNAIRMVQLGKYSGITYIRHSVDDVPKEEEVGFLSGNLEKMAVYLHPLHDSLESIVRTKYKESKLKGKEYEDFIQEKIETLMTECNIQAITGLGLRGRTLLNQYVIIDEAQNPSAPSMQKTLTRLGKGCKVAIIGSNRQIDNPYITKHNNGLSYLINSTRDTYSNVNIYGVDLHKVVRSAIAEFAELLYSKEVK